MIIVTFLFGLILIALGAVGYLSSESGSLTALIPAAFGVGLLAMGVWALAKENMRMHAMHIAVLIGAIGLVVPGVRIIMVNWGDFAMRMQLLMAIACGLYLAACIRSFMAARRAKKDAAKAA